MGYTTCHVIKILKHTALHLLNYTLQRLPYNLELMTSNLKRKSSCRMPYQTRKNYTTRHAMQPGASMTRHAKRSFFHAMDAQERIYTLNLNALPPGALSATSATSPPRRATTLNSRSSRTCWTSPRTGSMPHGATTGCCCCCCTRGTAGCCCCCARYAWGCGFICATRQGGTTKGMLQPRRR